MNKSSNKVKKQRKIGKYGPDRVGAGAGHRRRAGGEFVTIGYRRDGVRVCTG